MNFSDKLKKANEQLKAGRIDLAIEQRGSKLGIRGTFPPKPDSSARKSHQQRLSLGLPATPQGLKSAVAKAKEVSGQLAFNRFHWEDYLISPTSHILIGDAIALFESFYFSQRERTAQTLLTWREDYLKPFRRLPQNKPLDSDILKAIILESKPNTRQRKRLVLAYSALADKFKLDHNLRVFKGSYSPKEVNPRSLPDDSFLAHYCRSILNPEWLWVIRMMACYGLRNHEVFFCDLKDYPLCFVSKGKTGERYAYPLYPEWADQWNLKEGKPPNCSGKTHGDFGSRVTHALYRYNVPFNPYDIRHCWARRAFEFNLDPGLAARSMGHSLEVHCRTYRRWIDENTYRKVYERMIVQTDRPKPPN